MNLGFQNIPKIDGDIFCGGDDAIKKFYIQVKFL